ncbi:MAG: hypothetical protein IKL68_05740 [Clostridia bacterium]|nr:hypothetical protein [Clostridia bacterium]
MKHRKITKKEHKTKISLITFSLMIITIVILAAAVTTSINNRESFLMAIFSSSDETNNSVSIVNEMAKEVDLEVASSVATTSGKVALNVKAKSTNPKTFKEYRYYIKESANDMYVLDAIKIDEQHAYVKLEPNTSYDVKVEAVSHSGETMTSMTSGATPTID